MLPILSIYVIFDTVHGVQNGNIRALGKQGPASFITLICMYGLGVPLALYLGFRRHLNLVGFWEGFLAAMVTLDIVIMTLVVCSDWNIAEKKMNRTTSSIEDAESPYRLNSSREESLKEKLLDSQ